MCTSLPLEQDLSSRDSGQADVQQFEGSKLAAAPKGGGAKTEKGLLSLGMVGQSYWCYIIADGGASGDAYT
jgi:hypothetical protein